MASFWSFSAVSVSGAAPRGPHLPGHLRDALGVVAYQHRALDRISEGCHPGCAYSTWLLARGDAHRLKVTGPHATAQAARATRAHLHQRWRNRISWALDDLLWRLL
jgi:hypothetical protein